MTPVCRKKETVDKSGAAVGSSSHFDKYVVPASAGRHVKPAEAGTTCVERTVS